MADRRASGPSDAVLKNARTIKLLTATLGRAPHVAVSRSLRRQTIAIARLALKHLRARNNTIAPTMQEIATKAGCRIRQARTNLRKLEAWGVLAASGQTGGGAGATVYAFDGEALFRALVEIGCNPHPDLRSGLRATECSRPSAPEPRHWTPAVTPAVQRDFSFAVQCDNQKENTSKDVISPIYQSFVRADFFFPSNPRRSDGVRHCGEASESGRAEEATSGTSRPHVSCVEKKGAENKPVPTAPSDGPPDLVRVSSSAIETNQVGTARVMPVPSASEGDSHNGSSIDAERLLIHLEAHAPCSYGAAASDLGWGATRTWQAEAALKAAGHITHDCSGRMLLHTRG